MRPRPTTTDVVEPAILEDRAVAFLLALTSMAQQIGACSLLYAHVNWDSMNVSANPPGAPTPEVARGSYTRTALRQYHARRVALRSGPRGLARAIAA